MRKLQELSTPTSCLNHARPEEILFVLLGRDAAAPETIRFWARERVRLGKNAETDPQVAEALELAAQMEAERGRG